METSPTRVLLRVRPTNASESDKDVCVSCPTSTRIQCGDDETQHVFALDHAFTEKTSQEEIYEAVQPIVRGVMDGINGSILTYGQTGSGKTHTLIGDLSAAKGQGIVPRAAQELMRRRNADDVFVTVSAAEIYCERILDLLDVSNVDLNIKEDQSRGVYIHGLVELTVGTEQELQATMERAISNRTVGSTAMNKQSSRSHCIINIQFKHRTTQSTSFGKLCMVDLAGSERASKTEAVGVSLDEGILINKSLSALANVICALSDKKARHVPYRDSKLTRVLQDSLGGNSKTALIICCSPVKGSLGETLCSLRFGSRAKGITNVVQKASGASSLEEQLLKSQIECRHLKEQLEKMTSAERMGGGGWRGLLFEPLGVSQSTLAVIRYRAMLLGGVQFFMTLSLFIIEAIVLFPHS